MNSISRVVTLKMISALILLESSKVFADPEGAIVISGVQEVKNAV